MKKTLLTLTIIAATALSAPAQAKGLNGNWASEKPEDAGNKTFSTREFSFDGDRWDVKFTLFLDEAKTMPVFLFKGVGSYSVAAKSRKVKGAREAIFRFDKKFVTLLTDNADLVNNFGFAGCNLKKGNEQDITETGCSFLVSKTACGQEYDLVKMAGRKLFLGARPADGNMCSVDKRPIALGHALVKKE